MITKALQPADMPRRKGILHALSFERRDVTWYVHTQCAGTACGGLRWAYPLREWSKKDGRAKCRKCAIREAKAFKIGPKAELMPLPKAWSR